MIIKPKRVLQNKKNHKTLKYRYLNIKEIGKTGNIPRKKGVFPVAFLFRNLEFYSVTINHWLTKLQYQKIL